MRSRLWAKVETIAAELTITQPGELDLYQKAWAAAQPRPTTT